MSRTRPGQDSAPRASQASPVPWGAPLPSEHPRAALGSLAPSGSMVGQKSKSTTRTWGDQLAWLLSMQEAPPAGEAALALCSPRSYLSQVWGKTSFPWLAGTIVWVMLVFSQQGSFSPGSLQGCCFLKTPAVIQPLQLQPCTSFLAPAASVALILFFNQVQIHL